MFWNRDQITEYAIKSLQTFQLMIPFLYTLDCHLLNVAGCVTQTLNTFEITHFWDSFLWLVLVTCFHNVFSSPKTDKKTELYLNNAY